MGGALSMNNAYVHSATAKLPAANINFASFFAKLPNKIPANISGYTVPYTFWGTCDGEKEGKRKINKIENYMFGVLDLANG